MSTVWRGSCRLLWVALLACDAGDRPAPADSPISPPPPSATTSPSSVEYTSVEVIDARVDSIDNYLLRHADQLEVYAEVPGREELVPVRDSTDWPDETEASYNILRDSSGSLILHREIPTSESGDWFATITHYLAPDGRAILYVFEIAGFSSGCSGILRETKRVHLDTEFGVLREERAFTDNDGRPLDATACHRRSDDAPPPRRGVSALRGGESAPR